MFLAIMVSLLTVSFPAVAQQTTGQIAPKTRNPQATTTAPLQRQTNGVQSTSGEQLLRQDKTIRIPDGEKESEPDDSNAEGGSLFVLILILAVASVLIGIITLGKLKSKTLETQESIPIASSKPKRQISESQEKPATKQILKKKKRPANRPRKKRKKK